jgi:hypothetical protein
MNFSIEDIKFENTHDSRFKRVIIEAFADGENAHTQPISLEVLQHGSLTVYDIPVLCKYNKLFDDFEGHEPDEVAIGFIKETTATYSNPIRFETKQDGRTFLVIEGILWINYFKESIDVILRDKQKSVSVELTCAGKSDDDGKIEVADFILQGITILGDIIRPAVKGANMRLEFSHDKQEYLESINMADAISIDNTKDASVSGVWSNPRRKLFSPITKASNSVALLKEAYLIGDFSTTEPEITKFKYPHHVIRNGKMVVHINGLQHAFSRASAEGIVSGNVKSHLMRHYKELGLSIQNFSEFGFSEEEFNIYNELINESVGEKDMAKDVDKNTIVDGGDSTDKNKDEFADKTKDDTSTKNFDDDDVADVNDKDDDNDINDKDDDDNNDNNASNNSGQKDNPPEGKDTDMCDTIEKMQLKIDSLKQANKDLENSNKAYMEKLEKMNDYDELKKFKDEVEQKFSQEKQLVAMNTVLSEIEGRGVEMSNEEKKELIERFSDFGNNIEAWSNFAKAQVFDKAKNFDGIVRIAHPFDTKTTKSSSLWD